MKLSDHLLRSALSYAAFGRLCDPKLPRVTIRQYALEIRFPRSKKTIANIIKASGGNVTAADLCDVESDVAA